MADQVHNGAEEWLWVSVLLGLTVSTTVAAFWIGAKVGIPTGSIIDGYAYAVSLITPLILIAAATVLTTRAAILRVERPIRASQPFLKFRFGSPALAAGTITPMLIMPLFMGAFGALKQFMPLVAPFSADKWLPQIGRSIFRIPAWRFTHALFGDPISTMAIDRIYTAWVPLLFVAVFVVSAFAPRTIRARFFLSFAAGWVLLGLVAAYLFSSAGPCYAANVGAPMANDYAPLMQKLHAIDAAGYHLNALEWQDALWDAYSHHRYGFALGISAFPSMHNAISFLYVLAAWKSRPWVRAVTCAFATIILIGSVHLGWHYIADGLVAWPAMAAIWWGAGIYLRKCGYDRAVKGELEPVPPALSIPTIEEEEPELIAA
jgi:hypothetical protein